VHRLCLTIAAACVLAPAGTAAASSQKAGEPYLPPPRPTARSLQALGAEPGTLVSLDRQSARAAELGLRAAGGVLVSEELFLWLLPTAAARRVLPDLARAGLLRAVEPDRRAATSGHLEAGDPLLPDQWWLATVGADRAEPPGPGIPITILDTGLDVSHPEFAARPDTSLLNAQDVAPGETSSHGTSVASAAAAPSNGIGVVGAYPQAVLNAYDLGELRVHEIVAGLQAALDHCPGVVNMSYGSRERSQLEEDAVLRLFRAGCVPVAAAGNEFEEGNPIEFPASLNHVLTVAATNREDASSFFSNANLAVDLAAPGEEIPVAVPTWVDPSGFQRANGTSFAAPIVSGAAAWVWTARPELDHTQVFDLLRYAARDIDEPGWDVNTGFGILDIPKALTDEPPPSDSQEPNDDVYHVVRNGLFRTATPSLTDPGHPRADFEARLDLTEDPEDVYRVWVPGRSTVTTTLRGTRPVDLELWDATTPSVFVRGRQRQRHLIAASRRPGTRPDTVSVENTGRKGAFVFVDVFLTRNGPLDAAYTLRIRTSR